MVSFLYLIRCVRFNRRINYFTKFIFKTPSLLHEKGSLKSLSLQERDFPEGMPSARVSSLNQVSSLGN